MYIYIYTHIHYVYRHPGGGPLVPRRLHDVHRAGLYYMYVILYYYYYYHHLYIYIYPLDAIFYAMLYHSMPC